jgi:progressive ankylosis protein
VARLSAPGEGLPGTRRSIHGFVTEDRSPRAVLRFWAPLSAQWLMMSLEGPFLAAVIARLADPTFNLAAYGVAYALGILVESPVIMLMSASTALADGPESYRKLRTFALALYAFSTALLLLLLVPPVFEATVALIGLPEPVSVLVRGALWLLIPWPAAIGYRRFLHGLLIRSGRTRLVAYGTLLRLVAMAATALLLAFTTWPGAWVGAAALSAGVVVEAIAARFMAIGALRELRGGEPVPETARAAAAAAPGSAATSSYGAIARFYYPLALTSFIGLTVQPMLTFFMGRAPSPVESLAVFPVVHALTFLFRSFGLSFQEAAIALLGSRSEHAWELARFGAGLALASSGALALVAFTPLAGVWFETISGLPPELAAMALAPTRVAVALPALSVALSFQRALLVQDRTTQPITVATAIEVVGIAILFPVLGWGAGLAGVTAAMLAFLGGRIAGVLFLTGGAVRAVRRVRATAAARG